MLNLDVFIMLANFKMYLNRLSHFFKGKCYVGTAIFVKFRIKFRRINQCTPSIICF